MNSGAFPTRRIPNDMAGQRSQFLGHAGDSLRKLAPLHLPEAEMLYSDSTLPVNSCFEASPSW